MIQRLSSWMTVAHELSRKAKKIGTKINDDNYILYHIMCLPKYRGGCEKTPTTKMSKQQKMTSVSIQLCTLVTTKDNPFEMTQKVEPLTQVQPAKDWSNGFIKWKEL